MIQGITESKLNCISKLDFQRFTAQNATAELYCQTAKPCY